GSVDAYRGEIVRGDSAPRVGEIEPGPAREVLFGGGAVAGEEPVGEDAQRGVAIRRGALAGPVVEQHERRVIADVRGDADDTANAGRDQDVIAALRTRIDPGRVQHGDRVGAGQPPVSGQGGGEQVHRGID